MQLNKISFKVTHSNLHYCLKIFYLIFMSVLPIFVYVYHMNIKHTCRPQESTRLPGITLSNGIELSDLC